LVFYRVTRSNPPTLRDFQSNVEKRRRPPDYDPDTLRLWAGISVFDDLERARDRARLLPAMGSFVATMRVPAAGSIHYEQTGTDRHHFTVWGDPAALLVTVERIEPV
jgi:hypothetical protein